LSRLKMMIGCRASTLNFSSFLEHPSIVSHDLQRLLQSFHHRLFSCLSMIGFLIDPPLLPKPWVVDTFPIELRLFHIIGLHRAPRLQNTHASFHSCKGSKI
jgi:hypothetical protein